jgi:ATP-dependent RNA circularization protein (DNA/RNA ligase family)
MEYHKINSIYKRDMSKPGAPFIVGEWSEPAFEYLQNNQWEFTEKIDGTNIRVMFDGNDISFGGKTDNAQIPAHLAKKLEDIFLPRKTIFKEIFNKKDEKTNVILYGEGFGFKIQGKIGTDYLMNDADFVLFDVKIGDWWLERKNVYDIADKLGIKVCPVVGYGTIEEAIKLVKKGFKSAFGTAEAEGLVLRPTCELKDRSGRRIITKIKVRDFR